MSETTVSRTDKELRKLALDYINGKIFTSFDIQQGERESITSAVFMPLVFLSNEDRQEMLDEEVVMLYEYFGKAGRQSVNGYPTFASCYMMNKEDHSKWAEYVGEARDFQKQFVGEDDE